MDRTTAVFWSIITALACASLFFGVNVEKQRRGLQKGPGSLDNGDIVRLMRVVDGDTVVVKKEGSENVTVRMLGIKSFESKIEHDIGTSFGKAAEESITRMMRGNPVRVLLNSPPKDKRGRTLATLYSGDRDIGLQLVSQGLVLVYTVYPFPSMQLYLNEQDRARAAHRGLWSNKDMAERSEGLMREWQRSPQ